MAAQRQVRSRCPSRRARRSASTDAALTPNEVIRAILRAPVDLLWNGGIGTVVKASTETDADALDRSNDAIRVDATELRCRVVGEGGNLGLTQRARIEFARERRPRSTPTSSTTRPASTAPTTRSTSRSCSTSPCAAASSTRAERDALLARGHRGRRRARPLRLLPAGADPRPGGARLGDADVRLRGPDGRARGRGAARPRGRVPARLRGDGRAPALGPRPGAAGAGRPARLREAQPHRRAAASPRCPTTP